MSSPQVASASEGFDLPSRSLTSLVAAPLSSKLYGEDVSAHMVEAHTRRCGEHSLD